MTDLVLRNEAPPVISDREIDSLFRVSKALAMSGLFKDTRQAEQAFAKVLIGRDLGLSPTQSMMGIDLIQGKPELSANLQATFVRKYRGPDGERYDFKQRELTKEVCRLEFFRKEPDTDWESLGESKFTMDDARDAGLAGRDMYKKFARNMLWARAMTNGVAMFCPEVTGGIRVYSEGEISGVDKPPVIGPNPEDPPSDIPSDWPPKDDTTPLPVATDEKGQTVYDDPEPLIESQRWAADIANEFKARGMNVGDFRRILTDAGVTPPEDLRSLETRVGFLAALSIDQQNRVAQLLIEAGNVKTEAA